MDDSLCSLFEELAGKYEQLMNECRVLLSTETVSTVPILYGDLDKLLHLTESVSRRFQEDIHPALYEDSSISGIMAMDKWQESRFSPEALDKHLAEIRDNVKRVAWYVEDAHAQDLHVLLDREVSEYAEEEDMNTIISFTFNRAAFQSKQLENACNCLKDGDFQPVSSVEPAQDEKVNGLVLILVVFDLFVLYSKENPHLKFALSRGSLNPDDNFAYTSITTKDDGEEHFTLPGQPNKPSCVEKTSSSLTLRLSPGEIGADNVTGYRLQVFELGALKRTDDVDRAAGEDVTEYEVGDLVPGMEYSFKVQSVSRAGNSPKSPMSEKVPLDGSLHVEDAQLHVLLQDAQLSGDEEESDSTASELSEDELAVDGGQVVCFARSRFGSGTGFKRSLSLGSALVSDREYSTGNEGGRRNLSKSAYERDLRKEHTYKRSNMSRAEIYEHEKRLGRDIGSLKYK